MSEVESNWRIPKWYPELSSQNLERLKVYFDHLVESNRRTDLVLSRTMPFADLLHFADSIQSSKMIVSNTVLNEVFDFGSGAGFPGMVMAILNPKIHLKLVESNPKKANFLNEIKVSLQLENVEVLSQSIESLPPNSVETAITRGFGPISKTLLSTRKLVKTGGRIFHVKGEEWATEVSQIPSQLCVFWKPSHIGNYKLPMGEVTFSVVKTDKVRD